MRRIFQRALGYFMLMTTLVATSGVSQAQIKAISENKDFVDISGFKNVNADIRYATRNNFTGENLYGDFKTPYLHKDAALKFSKASDFLAKRKPGWRFLIFDALRPRSIQKKLWAKVVGTEQQQYVADPALGSIHNYGFALDLSLLDERGREVDMGTAFDSFEEKAQPKFEEKFLASGALTAAQIANRQILRAVMTEAGFAQLPHEWWHYDAITRDEVKKKYKIVE